MELKRFLKPRTIAIIGATEKEGFAGGTCMNNIQYSKDLGNVYFVNPKRETVFNKPCVKSLSDIEGTVDAVVIGTPKSTVIPLLREAKAKGAAGAVVFASGYSEVGTPEGLADEQELKAVAMELDMAIMGPNCAGFVNYIDQTYCYSILHPERDRRGSVGFVSQSGQVCMSLMDSPNMTFSYCISCGNSKCVSAEEYLDFLIDDGDTKVVALYLEGSNDPNRLEACFRKAAQVHKPLIVLKVGASERAGAIAASHTGSLAGNDAVFDALFKKYGVIRVSDMQELLSTSLAFAELRALPRGKRFAVICLSGGETAICADLGFKTGISYADFQQGTKDKLKTLLPFYASPENNPLDITATPAYQPEVLAETLLAVLNDDNVDMVILGFTLMDEIVDNSFYIMFDGIKMALEQSTKPFACLNFIEMSRNADLTNRFKELGVPMLPCTKYAFDVLRHLQNYIAYRYADREPGISMPERKLSGKRRALSEFESKELLALYGVPVPPSNVVKTREEAVEAGRSIGFPLAMKIESSEILHKSDVGGVKLGITSEAEIEKTFDEITASVCEKAPGAKYNGILVTKMLDYGTEIILGIKNDPQFGPMLLVGLGGVFVEVFHDTALYPVTLNKFEAEEMLKSLKSYQLFKGYRGAPPRDIGALTEMMVAVSKFAQRNKDRLVEMDLNPLIVYPEGKGVSIADALIVLAE